MTQHVAGRRFLLTRTESGNAAWAQALHAMGATALSLPCIDIGVGPDTEAPLRSALRGCDLLAFTSAQAVAVVRTWIPRLPPGVRIAAVGPTTAAAAREAWGRPVELAGGGTGAALAAHLAHLHPRPKRIVLPVAEGGGRAFAAGARAAGIRVTRLQVYAAVPRSRPPAGRLPWPSPCDAVLVASPSALRGLCAQVDVPPDAPFVSIGPTTSEALRAAGYRVYAEASSRDLRGLVRAFLDVPKKRSPV